MKKKTVNFSIVLLLLILVLQTMPLNAVYAESPDGEAGENSVQQAPVPEEEAEPLSDGTYEAIVKTDSSMFRVTEAKLLVKEGKMIGIFTLAGSGFDRLYLGEADGKVGLSDDETIGYKSFDGKKYTFWPVEFDDFDKDYQISARSYKKKRWYRHTFRVQKEGIRKISDDVQYMTSQDEADKYIENLRKHGNIMALNADSIKKNGTTYTFPYFNQSMKPIDIFKLVSPPSSLLKYRYDIEDSGKYIRKSRISQNKYWLYPRKNIEESFKVTLNLFDPGADPAAIRGGELAPLAKETFTFVLEPAPENLELSFKVLDKKTNLPVEAAKVVIKDSAGKEIEAENGKYNLNGGVRYSLEISADGYISTEGEEILKDLLAPSKSEEKTYYLIKRDEGLHRVNFRAIGDDGKKPENLEINLYNKLKKVSPEEDGSYILVDGKTYRIQASADFYKSFVEDMTFEEDKNVTLTLLALSSTFKLKIDTNVKSYTVKMYMQEEGKEEIEVPVEEDGSFRVKRRARIRYVVTADGYEPEEIRLENGFSGEREELTQYISLNETPRLRLSKEISKLETLLDEVIEGEKPGNYPAGTVKLLKDAISRAENLVKKEDTPNERLEEESAAIRKLITETRKSQIEEENLVHFLIRDGAGKPAYRKDVIVHAGMCAKYGFYKSGSKQKKTTVLDGILALHEDLYGEKFQSAPKDFFDMPMMIKKIFAVNLRNFAAGFAVNGIICDYINIDDRSLKQDDYVDIFYSADKNLNRSKILGFDKPEYDTEINKSLQIGLWQKSASPIFSDEKAEMADGYKVVLENIETKTRVEAVSSGDEKNLSFSFEEPGQYVVKEVSKDGESDIIYPYCLIRVKDAEKKPEEPENPDKKDPEKPHKPGNNDNENSQEPGKSEDNKDVEKPHKPGNNNDPDSPKKPDKPAIVPGDESKVTYRLIEVDGEKWMEGGKIIWRKGSKEGLEFRIDGDFSGFRGIKLDGSDPDTGKYSVSPGSTVIKIEPDILESLKLGEHKLVASYDDGSLEINFTVAAKAKGNVKPNTGEKPDLIIYFSLMAFTVFVIGLLLRRLKKRDKSELYY